MEKTSTDDTRGRGSSIPQAASGMYERAKDTAREMTQGQGVRPGQRDEGQVTKGIERVTSRIPSGTFLTVALGSIGIAAALQWMGRKSDANFVGQWVPTILIMGLYNKLVKLEGSRSSS